MNHRPSWAGAALSLAIAASPALAGGINDRVEGTWINDVRIYVCGTTNVIASFPSLTSYLRGGIAIEGGAPATPPPAVSRSAGHGVWERTGRRTITATFRSHSFDSLGRLVRITEVTTQPELHDGDNPATAEVEPYYLSGYGTNRITTLDPATGAVTGVTQGCNYATSRPLLPAH